MMKYSPHLSLLYYLCGFFYMGFGTYAIDTNAKSYVNRLLADIQDEVLVILAIEIAHR
jgi:hypothetical protein